MIVLPKTRGFICTTAHPIGCAQGVLEQIEYVRDHPRIDNGPKKALVIGASTGYGLAARVVAAFGCTASTVGVFFEKPPENKRTATAGWYNVIAFEKEAHHCGLYAKGINGDAFSDEIKSKTLELVKKDLQELDLVIYSLAAPRRIHPKSGRIAKSVLKPIGVSYTNKTLDLDTGEILTITIPAANQEEIEQTISVMGGEDWEMWVDALLEKGLLAPDCLTVAYSYFGPDVTRPVYRNGTIGAAKDHLEQTAKQLSEKLKSQNGRALVSINKALVTQSSTAIPFVPLYYILLSKVLKEKGINEGCIEQMYRLFKERLYTQGEIPLDKEGRIRIDDVEMREDVQQEVKKLWEKVTTDNVRQLSDFEGFRQEFLRLFGFGFNDVDYNADVDIELQLS